MMKAIKWVVAAAVAVSLTGCIIPADGNYNNGYRDGGHHNKHKKHYDTETGGGYQSADGVTMLTREGRTLPACGEVEGASQADNGNTCWW